jgi:hypothetical protein
MELDHRHLEFPSQVEVQAERYSEMEVPELLVAVEPTTGPVVARELLGKDLREVRHQRLAEVVEVEVPAKQVTQMVMLMVVTARSVQ